MQLSIELDLANDQSLQFQIFESIRNQILSGRLKPNTLLPSTRLLSDQLNVSRNTVVNAYDHLIAEDYIQSRKTIGTFVSPELPESSLTLIRFKKSQSAIEDRHSSRYPVNFNGEVEQFHLLDKDKLEIDFSLGFPDPDSFPINSWRKIMIDKLDNAGSDLTKYHDQEGIFDLRNAIAEHLLPARNIDVDPDQIIIVNGSQEALNIISRLNIKKGTEIVTECPCYRAAVDVMGSYGAKINPVNVDDNGLIISKLPDRPIGMAYITPSHQYPMGGTLSLDRRIKLLDWASDVGAYIVEDDRGSDFRYHSSPLTAVAGYDPHGCTIYMNTFSKSISAGLRLGYIIVPPELVEPAKMIKRLLNNGHPWLDQAVLAEFIARGLYVKHLRRIRRTYLSRRDCLISVLQKYFGNIKLSGLEGGTHLIWELSGDFPEATAMKLIAADLGVGIYTINSCGAYDFEKTKISKRALIFGYSALPEDKITEGIVRLASSSEIK